MKWKPSLLIMRPANIITAIADVLAGIAIVGVFAATTISAHTVINIILLCFATAGLYGGGIIFNDVFDFENDKINRPERILPSKQLSLKQAKALGITLFIFSAICSFFVSLFSFIIALLIISAALFYDKYSKHNTFFGPLNMGLCRGLNLILGMSIAYPVAPKFFVIGILPMLFIAAITLTAQKETKGKNKRAIGFAMVLDALIILGFLLIDSRFNFSLKNAFFFLLIWYLVNTAAKINAILKNNPKFIMQAVKIGVISLIPLNASYIAGFSSVYMALLILLLLPISLYLSKKFPVT